MAPQPYESHVYSLPSAFNSSHWEQTPEAQNQGSEPLMLTFNSEGNSVVRKQRQRANTVPWNQGSISFDNLSESASGHSASSTQPNFRLGHGVHTPRMPSNAFAQAMDVDYPNAQTNIEPDSNSGSDWGMDGYLLMYILRC